MRQIVNWEHVNGINMQIPISYKYSLREPAFLDLPLPYQGLIIKDIEVIACRSYSVAQLVVLPAPAFEQIMLPAMGPDIHLRERQGDLGHMAAPGGKKAKPGFVIREATEMIPVRLLVADSRAIEREPSRCIVRYRL